MEIGGQGQSGEDQPVKTVLRTVQALILIPILLTTTGCGYTLQNSHSPLSEKEGIQKVYLRPLLNNTFKVGVENAVFNALLKTIVAHRRVSVVSRPEEADAILEGTVNVAQYSGMAATAILGRTVTSQYNAILNCSFKLNRRNPGPRQKQLLWSGAFQRTKPFASAVQAGVRGETTAPLNESEFDRVLSDLATGMVGEVHESMLAMF
jgi:hypothetical protein